MLSLQIKSVINATAFINKNQSGNKPWVVSWKVHSNRQLHGSFLLHVPSLKGFKGFRKLSLYSGSILIGNIEQYKPVNKQALGSGKWESKSVLAFIRFYKAVLRAYKPWPLSKVWREQCEIYGEKKSRNMLAWGGKKSHAVKNCLKLSAMKVTAIFSFVFQLAHTHTSWNPVSIAFPSLAPTCWVLPTDLHHVPTPEQLCRHGIQLHEPQRGTSGAHGLNQSQDPSGKYKCRRIWLQVSSQLADTQNASLPPSILPRQCCFAGRFAPSPSAVFVSKGFAWFCFLMRCWYCLPHSFFHGQ